MRCRACDGCVMRAADDACMMVRMLHARRRIVSRVHVYGLGVSAQKRDSKTRSYIRVYIVRRYLYPFGGLLLT